MFRIFERTNRGIAIKNLNGDSRTRTDLYWSRHTVNSTPFHSTAESLKYLEWRFEQYPLFREFMGLYGQHDNEIILDYGCGPGNDLVGFSVYTKAKRIIGIDVSEKALRLAAIRLKLHRIPSDRIELIQTSDAQTAIPLGDCSVDHIYCEGVLHHTSEPERILREFRRVLKPGAKACIMVYNRNSVWFHLYTAYDKIILKRAFEGLTVEEAFSRNTDGEECPISRCYLPEDFITICRAAGFHAEFAGGYLSLLELGLLKELLHQALEDERLGGGHRAFLSELSYDTRNYPLYQGKCAGIGGVYWLSKK